MSTIVFSVGCSGSGKSLLGNNLKKRLPDLRIVCMDDIRQEMTGDVSDQSQNEKVFKASQSAIHDTLIKDEDVYVSATNLVGKTGLVKQIAALQEKYKNLHAIVVFFTDSKDPRACLKRVMSDLNSGVDRSRVPEDVIDKQHKRFMAMYDTPWIQERTILGIDVVDVPNAANEAKADEIAAKVKKNWKK
jgi:predicted kinase